MAIDVKTGFMDKARSFGATDINACFNCGNCTAVCPLSKEGASFPRRMIRLAQIGAEDALLRSPEPWLCYYCGECSDTCPRQAGPSEYLAALRRYQISSLDPTGFGSLMFRSPLAGIGISLLVAVILGAVLVGGPAQKGSFPHWPFSNLVPYEAVHLAGMVVGAALALLLGVSLIQMFRRLEMGKALKSGYFFKGLTWMSSEIALMRRHAECTSAPDRKLPFYVNPRYVHLMIMWGFFALLAATTLDFLFVYALKWPIFIPARIIGTAGGLIMLVGLLMAAARRIHGKDRSAKQTTFADGWLIVYLLILTITGFWLEVVVTLGISGTIHDWVLLIHAVMAMELVLFVGMTKLAHAVYRPLALLVQFTRQEGKNP